MASNTVIPHSRELQRAVQWISERRQQDPELPLSRLISEAGGRFNLSPADQDALLRLLTEER